MKTLVAGLLVIVPPEALVVTVRLFVPTVPPEAFVVTVPLFVVTVKLSVRKAESWEGSICRVLAEMSMSPLAAIWALDKTMDPAVAEKSLTTAKFTPLIICRSALSIVWALASMKPLLTKDR